MQDLEKLLDIAKVATKKACDEILKVYSSEDFSVSNKVDNSPLTKADQNSHKVIVEELKSTGIPILSEEGKEIPFEERNSWDLFWMIDPLDGTKEFIKRNGEFTTNIALIKDSIPILGVVGVPTKSKTYFAIKSKGAFVGVEGSFTRLRANRFSMSSDKLKVVASRSHLNDETLQFMDQLEDPEIVSMGSSLKLLAIAEGSADLYPRFAPTMEWDTAAAQIIVEESGGKVISKETNTKMMYNKESLLNPHFLVKGGVDE